MDDPRLPITGVDLVDFFAEPPHRGVESVTAPVGSFVPRRSYDLATFVHGLHYIGDRVGRPHPRGVVARPDGLLVANLDLAAVGSEQGSPLRRRLTGPLRSTGSTTTRAAAASRARATGR
ncbi:hypothetical protein ACRAKI_10355 [Saccharothrix isguenensis]